MFTNITSEPASPLRPSGRGRGPGSRPETAAATGPRTLPRPLSPCVLTLGWAHIDDGDAGFQKRLSPAGLGDEAFKRGHLRPPMAHPHFRTPTLGRVPRSRSSHRPRTRPQAQHLRSPGGLHTAKQHGPASAAPERGSLPPAAKLPVEKQGGDAQAEQQEAKQRILAADFASHVQPQPLLQLLPHRTRPGHHLRCCDCS